PRGVFSLIGTSILVFCLGVAHRGGIDWPRQWDGHTSGERARGKFSTGSADEAHPNLCVASADPRRGKVCPNRARPRRTRAHSYAPAQRRRRDFALVRQAFARTSATRDPGLQILVSAVQSRPCPAFLPGSCRSRNSRHVCECAQIVPVASALRLTWADVTEGNRR